jgi:N-methylhydantoinase A
MQFKGQTHLIKVALPHPTITRQELQALFERAYFDRFQVELSEIRAVLVNVNTSVIGRRRRVDLSALIDTSAAKTTLAEAEIGTRPVYFDGGLLETAIYDRDLLPLGAAIAGPTVIEQSDSTVLIEPGLTATGDDQGNLTIDVPLIATRRHDERDAAA